MWNISCFSDVSLATVFIPNQLTISLTPQHQNAPDNGDATIPVPPPQSPWPTQLGQVAKIVVRHRGSILILIPLTQATTAATSATDVGGSRGLVLILVSGTLDLKRWQQNPSQCLESRGSVVHALHGQ